MLSWTTAGRPANPQQGLFGFNRTTLALEYWDGAAWQAVGGGGAACFDGIVAYDNAGAQVIGGAQIGMDTTQANTDATNYGLSTVVAGAITILNDGDYLIRHVLVGSDAGTMAPLSLQSVIQTTPSGLGTWANVIGADSYGSLGMAAAAMGLPCSTAVGEALVQISGGGGLDVQIQGNMIMGMAPVSFGAASRLVVQRIC